MRVSFNEDKLNLITGFYLALLTYVAAPFQKNTRESATNETKKTNRSPKIVYYIKTALIYIYVYMYSLNVPETSANGCREEHAYDAFAVDDGDDDLRSAAQHF